MKAGPEGNRTLLTATTVVNCLQLQLLYHDDGCSLTTRLPEYNCRKRDTTVVQEQVTTAAP